MTIEDQIAALIAEAEPLRLLSEDDPEREPLTEIVDEINRLRAIESGDVRQMPSVPEVDPLAPVIDDKTTALPARRPGRPRKPN
jgi:hypothetical protein